MPDAFSAAIDTLFADANLSGPGTYTPQGAAPQAVRVLKRIPQTTDISLGQSRASTNGILLCLRTSEVTVKPRRGDTLVFGGVTYAIEGVKETVRNLEWAMDCLAQ